MIRIFFRGALVFFVLTSGSLAWCMDLEWTRMTGQYPVDANLLVLDIDGDGQDEILAVNLGGQVMLWNGAGEAKGPGQDGTIAQLPEGRWTTAPVFLDAQAGPAFVFVSVEGLVVATGRDVSILWQYQLPGETSWSRALPTPIRLAEATALCIADNSGTVSCLNLEGTLLWSKHLGNEPCRTVLRAYASGEECESILVPSGDTIVCLDPAGEELWQRDLGGPILSSPELARMPDGPRILCGAGSGSLFTLNMDGEILWDAPVGDEIDHSITVVEREDEPSMVLCTGVWGNLHAFTLQGKHLWTHLFRAKTRSKPLLMDANGDGKDEIVLTAYNQRLYVFDFSGNLVDEIRLSGLPHASAVAIRSEARGQLDALVVTKALLLHRLRPGTFRSPYGPAGEPKDIRLRPPAAQCDSFPPGLVLENPHGALLRINVSRTNPSGETWTRGCVTIRSLLDIPLPQSPADGSPPFHVQIHDPSGTLLLDEQVSFPPNNPLPPPPPGLTAWPTPAYASFEDTQLNACTGETQPDSPRTPEIAIGPLCGGETGEGALIVASGFDKPQRVRVTLDLPSGDAGQAFGGVFTLREVVPTPAINGEMAADALPRLSEAGLLTIPAKHAAKIWIGVDTAAAEPGLYQGAVTVRTLSGEAEDLRLPLIIHVLPLALPKDFPLAMCTWDYVPQERWFSGLLDRILDDLGGHGVNIFPRAGLPSARQTVTGDLVIDWTNLDALLDDLSGRGITLFQLQTPSIQALESTSPEDKHSLALDYLLRFRDHLKNHGWGYQDYAFYPTDEPGLDHGRRVPALVAAADLFHEADPQFQVYTDPVHGLSWKDFEQIAPRMEVWCPEMELVTGLLVQDPRMREIMASGKPVWSYECFSQVKSLSPLRYNRANAWRARFFGLDGIGFWTYAQTKRDHWFQGEGFEEYALVYPGELPVPSVRWEAARDGLEDIAAVSLLEAGMDKLRTLQTNADLLKDAEDALRFALADMMELSGEAFIQSRDFLRKGDRRLWHTPADLEMIQAHRERLARFTLEINAAVEAGLAS